MAACDRAIAIKPENAEGWRAAQLYRN